MVILLLLLSSFLQSSESCLPTWPGNIPAPITCGPLCPPSLLVVTPPFVDTPSTVGACAVRTLLCMGPPLYPRAAITYNSGPMVYDDGTGTAIMVVTCNAAGTAWTYMGTAVTSATCALF